MTQAAAPKPALAPTPRPAVGAHSGPPEPLPMQKRAFADALARSSVKDGNVRKEQLADAGPFTAIMPREFAGIPMAETASPAGDVDPAFHAQLDRIAAAIAEVAKTGAEPEVHLALPLGNYRIEGAVLGRDPAGQVNVVLISGAAVPPTIAAQWSEQLGERLLRREVRVGRIGVQASGRRPNPAA
ncbi:hypothetical protein [Sphingomonas sp. DT-204]|uniref:hypothetical protein n=1 Tax=Sphingomonas sp. DT-204 TaxID=3396166 RepID=UPI003F1B8F7A